MSVMFANTRGTPSTNNGYLLEFMAGRFTLEPGSGPNKCKCVPLPTKGLIYIKQSSDQLLHFCWKSREAKRDTKNELDLIIFPGDTEFIRIHECVEGRAYMLKFKLSSEKHIFWLQDVNTEKDDEFCDKVNDLLNSPPSARSLGRANDRNSVNNGFSGFSALNNALGNNDEIGALGNMDQNQIMQLFSLMNSGGVATDPLLPQIGLNLNKTDASAKDTHTPVMPGRKKPLVNSTMLNKKIIDQEALNAILKNIPDKNIEKVSLNQPYVDFSKILSRVNVQDVVMENSERLIPLLPKQKSHSEEKIELEKTIGNPQFVQSADFFGYALQAGKLAEALPHFGFKENSVLSAAKGDLIGFAKCLTEQEQKGEKRSSLTEGCSTDTTEIKEELVSEPPNAKRGKTEDTMDLD